MAYYSYPGGVTVEEEPLMEKFERDVLPFTRKHGPEIGEAAMKGDVVAEEIIKRSHLFVNGVPEMRQSNFDILVAALKKWEARRLH